MKNPEKTLEVKYPKVEIIWQDTFSIPGWHMISDLDREELIIYSIGYLIEEGAENALIVQSLSTGEEKVGDALSIPRKMIRKIRKLK